MKAITILQPYAYGVMVGAKRIENRSFRTSHRGPLAIHASKSRAEVAPPGMRELLADERTEVPPSESLTYGAIVAIVDLVDCVRAEELPAEFAGDPFAAGPFCWILANPKPLATPIPCSGARMVWDVSGDVAERVQYAILADAKIVFDRVS